MKLLALETKEGLDGKVNSTVRAAGYFGAVTTFRTFKKIGAAHAKFFVEVCAWKWWVGRDSNPGPTA